MLGRTVNETAIVFQYLPSAIGAIFDGMQAGNGIVSTLTSTFSSLTAAISPTTAIILGVAAAIGAVVAVTAVWANTQKDLENATEKADESIQQYSETVSELESLKSEYESLQDQIEELNELKMDGGISIEQETELQNLQAQSDELERQIELYESLAKSQQETAADDANAALTTEQTLLEHNREKYGNIWGTILTLGSGTSQEDFGTGKAITTKSEWEAKDTTMIGLLEESTDQLESDRKDLLEVQDKIDEALLNGEDTTSLYANEALIEERIRNDKEDIQARADEVLSYTQYLDENSDKYGSIYKKAMGAVDDATLALYDTEAEKANEEINRYLSRQIDEEDIRAQLQDAVDKGLDLEGVLSDLHIDVSDMGADVSLDYLIEYFTATSEAAEDMEKVVDDAFRQMLDNVPDEPENLTGSKADLAEYKEYQQELEDAENTYRDLSRWYANLDDSDKELVYSIALDYDTAKWELEDWEGALEQAQHDAVVNWTIDIDAETAGLDSVTTALTESNSANGLTAESLEALKSRYQNLEGYDYSELFERTSVGIKLNTSALQDLEQEYNKDKSDHYRAKLEQLTDDYNAARLALNDYSGDAAGYAAQLGEVTRIEGEINDCVELVSQYDALSSSYNKWQSAMSDGSNRDTIDTISGAYSDMKDILDRGWINDDDLTSYLELMLDADQLTGDTEADFAKLTQTINGTNHSIMDYFTEDDNGNLTSEGVICFLEDVNKLLGEEKAWQDENGQWFTQLNEEDIEELATKTGMSTELIQYMLQSARDIGTVDLTDIGSYLNTIGKTASEAGKELEEMNLTSADFEGFDFAADSVKDFEAQIEEAQRIYDQFIDEDGNFDIEADGAQEALIVLSQLIINKQELEKPAIMSIDTSEIDDADSDVANALELFQQYTEANNELELTIALGEDGSEAAEKVQDLANQLSEIDSEVLVRAGIDEGSVDTLKAQLQNVVDGDFDIEANVLLSQNWADAVQDQIASINLSDIDIEIPDVAISDNSEEVIADINSIDEAGKKLDNTKYSIQVNEDGNATDRLVAISNRLSSLDNKSATVTVTTVERTVKQTYTSKSEAYPWRYPTANGTAHASGTAEKSGNWGVDETGNALVGELGPEIVVHGSSWRTVGDDGAEVTKIHAGDIVFNADQTEQILKYGKIKTGKRRGTSYAHGTAYANRATGGTVSVKRGKTNKTTGNRAGVTYNVDTGDNSTVNIGSSSGGSSNNNTGKTKTKSSGGSGGGNSSSEDKQLEDFKDWFEEFVDWIEILLERQTDRIDQYVAKAESALDSGKYSSARKNYRAAVRETTTQIGYEQRGATRYQKQADKVLSKAQSSGLINADQASGIANKVANGTIDINDYSERVREVIQDYQEWYDKANDCSNAIQELHDNIREYVKSLKEVIDTQRDLKISNAESYESVATSTEAASATVQNQQLRVSISRAKTTNKAYRSATKASEKEVDKTSSGTLANSAAHAVTKAKKNKSNSSKYKSALDSAQKAIKAGKSISSSVLSVIKKHSLETYETLYAYNEAIGNLEEARLEEATNYAATNSEIYSNRAEKFSNKRNTYDTQLSNYKTEYDLSGSTSTKNSILNKELRVDRKYVKNDSKAIKQYTKNQNSASDAIKAIKTSSGTNAKARNLIKKIKKQVKTGEEINASDMSSLTKYYEKGYVSWDLISSCISYNNAVAYRKEAEDQRVIDEQTLLQQKVEARSTKQQNKMEDFSTKQTFISSISATTAKSKNNQLEYSNKLLGKENDTYHKTVTSAQKATKVTSKGSAAKTANNRLTTERAKSGNSKKYKKALKNAQNAVKKGKAVSTSDLKIIKSNNSNLYEEVLMYNEALEELETAREEYALEYATNSAEIFSNIAEEYSNRDEESNSNISLYEAKSGNATSAKSKNSYLTQAIGELDTILSNDTAEIKEYKSKRKSATSKMSSAVSSGSYKTSTYKSLSKSERKKIRDNVQKATRRAKAGKEISSSLMETLRGYYDKGYISASFYNSVVNYENALESETEARAQRDIDKETIKAQKAAYGTEMLENVEQEYTNKATSNQNRTDLIEAQQATQTTRGIAMTKTDYQELITQSKDLQKIYQDESNAMKKQIQDNIKSGLWTTASQEYIDAMDALAQLDVQIENCSTDQEEWYNAIAQLPYDAIDNTLSLLTAIEACDKALASLQETRGIRLTESDYQIQIGDLEDQIKQQTNGMNQAWKDYQKALSDPDQVYGGKTADEWLELYYNYKTSVIDLTENVEELNNAIANIPYETIEATLDLLKAIADFNKSVSDLKSTLGEDLSEQDYLTQISDINDQIEQYEKERDQAWEDYQKALADPDGVYGGKTADEWLQKYYEFDTEVNNSLADVEDLRDALRDDVYWRTFERAHDECQRFSDVVSGLQGLITDDMLFDSDGHLTDYGVTQIANMVAQYETAQQEVQNYSNDIDNLNKLYADGWYEEQEYIEKLNELQVSLLDAASSMQSAMDEITNTYKDMSQNELDALNDLIDARSKALQAKKDYYDYDKSIKSKTDEITSLKAQIAALEGVETAEAKAKKATLEAQLKEAEEDLDDTVQDHIIEISQDALDELKETLQDAFDDYWDNINGNLEELANLMAIANDLTEASTNTIVATMNKLLSYYGIDPVATGVDAYYASGTKKVPHDMVAMTNEKGPEIITTKDGILIPLKAGDGVIPADVTQAIFDIAKNGGMNKVTAPEISIPRIDFSGSGEVNVEQHYDSLINIEGSADAATVEDLKNMKTEFLSDSYTYTRKHMNRDYQKAGGKRYV